MAVTFTTQIELDAQGTAWVAGANTKVTEIVLDKLAHGWSPEEIHFQHPHLSLAQIHAALTYYYENQPELDAQIRRSLGDADRLATEASDPGLRRQLLRIKNDRDS